MNSRFIRNIIFLLLFLIPCFSGISIYASDFSPVDSSRVVVRQTDPKFVESYKTQKDFNYLQPPLETNFLRQLFDYLKNRFGGWEKFSAVIPWIFKLLMGGLVVFILIIVIIKTRFYKVFYSDKEIETPDFALSNSEDLTSDPDEAIRLQIAQKQYRIAVRLLYLKVIYLLRRKECIRFSKERTNVDYWRDLTNDDLKSGFYAITSIYNHVWYGDIEIAEDQFLRFEKSFQCFYTTVDVQE